MSQFKIEKGIPLPTRREDSFTAILKKCDVGDSFIAAGNRNGFSGMGKRIGVKISSRKQPDGTFRVWRVA